MEKRIGIILILIEDKEFIVKLNQILSNHSSIILGRQGLPLRERNMNVISLIIEGNTDEISSLTGQLGRLKGVQVKSVLTKHKNAKKEK
jgi:putative iron-only hydrogenase system regulator